MFSFQRYHVEVSTPFIHKSKWDQWKSNAWLPASVHHHQAMLSNYSKRHYSTLLILNVFVVQVCSGPRYSSRIVEIQSGAIRGIILELNSQHLEPVEVSIGIYLIPFLSMEEVRCTNFVSDSRFRKSEGASELMV